MATGGSGPFAVLQYTKNGRIDFVLIVTAPGA